MPTVTLSRWVSVCGASLSLTRCQDRLGTRLRYPRIRPIQIVTFSLAPDTGDDLSWTPSLHPTLRYADHVTKLDNWLCIHRPIYSEPKRMRRPPLTQRAGLRSSARHKFLTCRATTLANTSSSFRDSGRFLIRADHSGTSTARSSSLALSALLARSKTQDMHANFAPQIATDNHAQTPLTQRSFCFRHESSNLL